MATVLAALISGPMYDPLYGAVKAIAASGGITVECCVSFDHPSLNAHLASVEYERYDLVSTHTKYAPSQSHFLAPLDDWINPNDLTDFAPRILELARVDGALLGIPRNIDVRLLHFRTDLIPHPPKTWDELFNVATDIAAGGQCAGFAYPGMESGLFGTFYELAESAGAELFPLNGVPDVENEAGNWALNLLKSFMKNGVAPRDLIHWHYDKVHEFFRAGQVAMIGDWPGFYSLHRNPQQSKVADRIGVCPYPAGPAGYSRVYGGSHTFALTKRGAANPAAKQVLRFLTSAHLQLDEARRGSVPVRHSVMRTIQSESSPQDLARWQSLENVLASDVVIPPKMAWYPEIEEVIWKTVQAAIVGILPVREALHVMTNQIREIRESHGR